jgi:hypothetical protein|tara:strand:+ start:67 stop:243 length:177 start_codon:yes stop_codon:yes gene_type:complete
LWNFADIKQLYNENKKFTTPSYYMEINPAVGGYIVGIIVGIAFWEILYRILKKNDHIE